MKKIVLLLSLGFFLHAQEFAVVTKRNSSLISLSKAKVKMIFLKKQKMAGERVLIPINLAPSNKIRKSFERTVLEMSRNRLKSFWMKEHYLGHRPPLTMNSSQSVLSFVTKIDGAIGYLPMSEVDTGACKILYRWKER